MKAKTIMVFGAGGQIGQAFTHHRLPSGWQLHALTRPQCDIADHPTVQSVIADLKPQLVINLAAMTSVDRCETDQKRAVAVNFESVANLAAQCSARDIPLIHLSTDYVFDGRDGGRPYTTHNKVNPLNFYGHTKMMGEEAVRQTHPWHVILRVSAVFSEFGANLLPRYLDMIDTQDVCDIPPGQIACPTYAPDIVMALVTIADALIAGKYDGFGTFHYCGEPAVSRLEFVEAIMAAYAPMTQRRPEIRAAQPNLRAAERPVYSVLDCTRIKQVYGIDQRPWRDALPGAIAASRQI